MVFSNCYNCPILIKTKRKAKETDRWAVWQVSEFDRRASFSAVLSRFEIGAKRARRSPRFVHELNARERNSGQVERPWRPRSRRSCGTREAQGACPGRFIIFFLFKCHFVACSAVYKTECVPRGSRVSYHLSSFVAYKHNSTRSLTRFILCLRIRSDTWERGRSTAEIASVFAVHGRS